MPDSTVTLRPNGTPTGGGWTVAGAATIHAALADNSDSSYVTVGSTSLFVDLDASAIPAGSVVRAATIRARVGTTSGSELLPLAVYDPTEGLADAARYASATTTITTVTLTTETLAPGGLAWTTAIVDRLQVELFAEVTSAVRVYAVYVDVAYNQQPTVTVTAPSGAVTNTTKPTVAWTYTDPEGDSQERYRMRVFPSSVYSAFGFDPETSTPAAYDSFDVISTAGSAQIGSALTNGATYRAYVKAADAGSSGRFGPWSYAEFPVAVDPPAVPTLAASFDAAHARVSLVVNGHDNNLTANQADLETNTVGWAVETNCTLSRATSVAAAHGNAFLVMTAVGNGDVSAKTLAGTSGVRVFGGTQYTAFASLRADTTGRFARVYVNWYDVGGALLSQVPSTLISSGTSSWTAATITATAPNNAAYAGVQAYVQSALATERHFVDAALVGPGTIASWTRGGLVPTQQVVLERSDDSGATWTGVRISATAPTNVAALTQPGQFGTFYDYEAPPGVAVIYRARITAADAGAALDSAYTATTSPLTVALTQAWLKDPLDPTVNTTIDVQLPIQTKKRERQAVYEPLGRTRPVVLRDSLLGEEGSLDIVCIGNSESDAVDAVRAKQRTVLIQTPLNQWFASLGEARDLVTDEAADTTSAYRRVSLPFVEVDPPG